MKIIVATNNQHKINEIQTIANAELKTAVAFISPKSVGINISPIEDGTTFEENAAIKAIAFYNAPENTQRLPVIADDSGLEIEALDGAPGIHSARFSSAAHDESNRAKVLQLLDGVSNRQARFVCVLAYYDGTAVRYFTGYCNGVIIEEERGVNGFGYDPIFIPENDHKNEHRTYDKTFAEMSDIEKNMLSHRYRALVEFCYSFGR